MEMLGLADVRGEATANVLHGDASGDVREHVDAALAVGVHRNPGETGKFCRDHCDPGNVHVVFDESFLNDAAVVVVADQAEPSGFGAQARDLGEIICSDAAGMNFEAIGVDLFFRAEQTRHQSKKIYGTASDSDYFGLRGHEYPCARSS